MNQIINNRQKAKANSHLGTFGFFLRTCHDEKPIELKLGTTSYNKTVIA